MRSYLLAGGVVALSALFLGCPPPTQDSKKAVAEKKESAPAPPAKASTPANTVETAKAADTAKATKVAKPAPAQLVATQAKLDVTGMS